MNKIKHFFQYLPFNCTKDVPEKYNKVCNFPCRGESYLLVLAQTLIKLKMQIKASELYQVELDVLDISDQFVRPLRAPKKTQQQKTWEREVTL